MVAKNDVISSLMVIETLLVDKKDYLWSAVVEAGLFNSVPVCSREVDRVGPSKAAKNLFSFHI